MPIGTSDGFQYEDEMSMLMDRPITRITVTPRPQEPVEIQPIQSTTDPQGRRPGVEQFGLESNTWAPDSDRDAFNQLKERQQRGEKLLPNQQQFFNWFDKNFSTEDEEEENTPMSSLPPNSMPTSGEQPPVGVDGLPLKSTETNDLDFSAKLGDALLGRGQERYKTWPEKAVASVIDAFKLPRDVFFGGEDPMSEKNIGRAFELAGAMVFGPAPIARKVADGTLGSFAGLGSATISNKRIDDFFALSKKGASREEIYEKTGFFEGVDGFVKYEISDEGAKFVPGAKVGLELNQPMKLDEVLHHPELFKAYPELKDIKVDFEPRSDRFLAAVRDDGGKPRITLTNASLNRPDYLLHEVQHLIQKLEGFAQGGSPARDFALRFEKEIAEAKSNFHFLSAYKKAGVQLTEQENADLLKASRLLQLERKRNIDRDPLTNRTEAQLEASRNYQKLAGEVESRNVEKRFNNNPGEFPEEFFKEFSSIARSLGYKIDMKKRAFEDLDVKFELRNIKTGEVVPTEKLPDTLKKALIRLEGERPRDLPPWLTEDTPRSQQMVSPNVMMTTPYGATLDPGSTIPAIPKK